MLVTFRSTATESITMFQDVAIQLLKLMGATGRIPGALGPEDVGDALQKLEHATEQIKAGTHVTAARPADNEDAQNEDEDEEREAPVDLATRAVPLLSILKRAAAANAEVMWEAKGK
ncbi:DUF1840 domain-containing protein [Steroidobacter sp.]|uniref:DUF1840 domain-containing protein n=1 Tax=Steroidobacter sp. TaxID=1978227 RepID=UPI001A37CB50|nr:DUF1840 domain-containing protein [Steroidobacter sp.]MBL8264995.1 DUF1840 domain-containing protein [Steroidobacter sp.]